MTAMSVCRMVLRQEAKDNAHRALCGRRARQKRRTEEVGIPMMLTHVLVCLGAGLAAGGAALASGTQDGAKPQGEGFVTTGVVCHVERDGGYYFIRSDDERDYRPGASLPEAFRKAPLRVRIEARLLNGGPATPRERGRRIEILQIERAGSPPPPARGVETWLTATGTVAYVPLEGGFFGIKSDSGKRYDPGGSLPEEFRKPDLRVRLEGKIPEGVATIRMWGEVLDIRKIEAAPVESRKKQKE